MNLIWGDPPASGMQLVIALVGPDGTICNALVKDFDPVAVLANGRDEAWPRYFEPALEYMAQKVAPAKVGA